MERSVSRIPIKIRVEIDAGARGELIRFLAPRTVEHIMEKMPIEGRIALMNEGIYFEISLNVGVEKGVKIVEAGTLAYWPMGNAICVFYGKTQPYSPVNVIGRITENLELFKNLKSGIKIRVELV